MQSSQGGWYRLYGLVVHSQLSLPEAAPAEPGGTPDVEVRRGALDVLAQAAAEQGRSQGRWIGVLADGTLWMRLLPGWYQVRQGREIIVSPDEGADPKLLRTFLLGSAFGFLLHQRGLYPIHGGAIASGGKALIVTGESGAGKSTMTSALVKQGFSFLADDVAAVRAAPEGPLVQPAYPQLKLCRDAAIALGYPLDALVFIDEDRDKFALRDAAYWCACAVPLRVMVELAVAEDTAVSVEQIRGHASLRLFLKSLYREFYYSLNEMSPGRMQEVLRIVSRVRFYRVTHPGTLSALDATAQAIAALLANDQPGEQPPTEG